MEEQLDDKILFIVVAVIGLFITVRFYFKKSKTIAEYVWGTGRMSLLPIVLSIFATNISCLSTSIASEYYQYGIHYAFESVALLFTTLVIVIQAPVILPYKLVSVNEYFLLRFDYKIKYLMSATLLIAQTTFTAIICYATAVQVKNILQASFLTCFLLTFFFCFLLTALGGYEGVLWTDAFQALLIVSSVVSVAVMGTREVGGVGRVIEVAYEDERLSVDFDPTKRLTLWTVLLGQTANWMTFNSLSNPALYQRFISLGEGQVKRGAFISLAIVSSYKLITCYTGLTMYAYYQGCDPVISGQLSGYDQIQPFFVADLDKKWGIVRSIYSIGYISAGVSTMSTLINTCGVVAYKDFLEVWVNPTGKALTGKITIVLVEVVMMFICTGLFQAIEGTDSITSLIPLYSTPCTIVASAFTLGMFVPLANSKGLLVGSVISLPMALLWSWSTNLVARKGFINYPFKPMKTDNCPFNNTLPVTTDNPPQADVFPLLRITVFYHPFFVFAIHFILTIAASRFFKSPSDKIDEKLVYKKCRRFIPKSYGHVASGEVLETETIVGDLEK